MRDPTGKFLGFVSPRYTQVPDELFDELLPDLSGAEVKVLLYVVRKTFGWKKASDQISISQMERGVRRTSDGTYLDRGTGLSRAAILRAVKGLVEKNILCKALRSSPEKGYMATEYALNVIDLAERVGRESGPTPSGQNGQGGRGPSVEERQGGHPPSVVLAHGGRDQKDSRLGRVKKQALDSEQDPQETQTQETIRQQHGDAPPETVLATELERRGVSTGVARQLVTHYAHRVPEKIDLFDWLVRSQSVLVGRNPAGWLRKAIEENYAPPPEYHRQRVEQAAADEKEFLRKERETIEREYRAFVSARVGEWRNSLPPAEFERLERQAEDEARATLSTFPDGLKEKVWARVVEGIIQEIGRNKLVLPNLGDWVQHQQARPISVGPSETNNS